MGSRGAKERKMEQGADGSDRGCCHGKSHGCDKEGLRELVVGGTLLERELAGLTLPGTEPAAKGRSPGREPSRSGRLQSDGNGGMEEKNGWLATRNRRNIRGNGTASSSIEDKNGERCGGLWRRCNHVARLIFFLASRRQSPSITDPINAISNETILLGNSRWD